MTKDELEKKVEELTGIIEEKDVTISERDIQIANLQADLEDIKASQINEIETFDPVWMYKGSVETGVLVSSAPALAKLEEEGFKPEPS